MNTRADNGFLKTREDFRGFTLLEVLVAMTVLALLVLLLMNMVDSAIKLWRINENRVEGYREPRAALGVIAKDLQNSVGSTNTNYFRLNSTSYVPAGATTGSNASHVFFLSALPKNAQWSSNANANRSDVCMVGYFVGYGQTSVASNAPTKTLNLYRFFLPSDSAYSNLVNTNLSSYPFPNPGTIIQTDRNVELLARNIISFRASGYITASQTNTNAGPLEFVTNYIPSPANVIPDLVEVTISAVSQDTAKRLPTEASWSQTNNNPIRDNIQVFTTRIHLDKNP